MHRRTRLAMISMFSQAAFIIAVTLLPEAQSIRATRCLSISLVTTLLSRTGAMFLFSEQITFQVFARILRQARHFISSDWPDCPATLCGSTRRFFMCIAGKQQVTVLPGLCQRNLLIAVMDRGMNICLDQTACSPCRSTATLPWGITVITATIDATGE